MSDRRKEVASTVLAAASFVVGAFGAVAFAWIYSVGPDALRGIHTQALGVSFMVALGGIGTGLVVWAHGLMPPGPDAQEREFPGPDAAERREMLRTYRRHTSAVGRRRLLGGLLATALGATGLAALFPFRSLGRSPFPERTRTGWRAGVRLVDEKGEPVRPTDLAVHGVLTVFPDGRVREADSQTILIRLPAPIAETYQGPFDAGPGGHVAFSKVCTHAGCPVGLYQVERQRLFCPCHQTAFDVVRGAEPIFGPATRSLPQLPLGVDDDGFLVALDDFAVPIGPGFWTLPSAKRQRTG